MAETRLTRDLDEAMLGGVLAGLAARYDWDVTPVRIVVVLLTLISVGIPGVVIYLAAWVIVPAASEIGSEAEGAEGTSAGSAAGAAVAGPETVVDEVTAAVQEAADRLAEAGQIAADAVRQAAEEIGEVARRPREDGSGADAGDSGSSGDGDARGEGDAE